MTLVFGDEMVVCLDHAYSDAKVERKGKWGVKKQEYNAKKYPTYCNGAGIVFTRKGTGIELQFLFSS